MAVAGEGRQKSSSGILAGAPAVVVERVRDESEARLLHRGSAHKRGVIRGEEAARKMARGVRWCSSP